MKNDLFEAMIDEFKNDARVNEAVIELDKSTSKTESHKCSVYFKCDMFDKQNISKRFTVRASRTTCKKAYLEYASNVVKIDNNHSIFYVATDENILNTLYNMFISDLCKQNNVNRTLFTDFDIKKACDDYARQYTTVRATKKVKKATKKAI